MRYAAYRIIGLFTRVYVCESCKARLRKGQAVCGNCRVWIDKSNYEL